MFNGSQQRACAYQRCGGWRLVRQYATPGGAQAWWGAQGLAGGQQSQFSVVTAATGGLGAGSRRCDLTQRKIHAVYEHGAASNVQREGCSPGLEQHRGTQTALGAEEDARKVSTGLLHKRELQWILGQWQKGQNVHSQVVERSGQAWVEWQLEMEDVRVSEARQRQIVEVTELATQLERHQIRVNVEEQRWVGEQIEGQGVEQPESFCKKYLGYEHSETCYRRIFFAPI